MKAAVLTNDRTLHFGDAPDPEIRRGEVLVRTSAAGICGTDLHVYRGEFHERVRLPAILGHEFMKEGEIIATRVTAGEFPRALRLLAKGLLHPERLITHEMPVRDVAAAFKLVDGENPGVIKVVLDMDEGG